MSFELGSFVQTWNLSSVVWQYRSTIYISAHNLLLPSWIRFNLKMYICTADMSGSNDVVWVWHKYRSSPSLHSGIYCILYIILIPMKLQLGLFGCWYQYWKCLSYCLKAGSGNAECVSLCTNMIPCPKTGPCYFPAASPEHVWWHFYCTCSPYPKNGKRIL